MQERAATSLEPRNSVEVEKQLQSFERNLENFDYVPTTLSTTHSDFIPDYAKTITSNGCQRLRLPAVPLIGNLFLLQLLLKQDIIASIRMVPRQDLWDAFVSLAPSGSLNLAKFSDLWGDVLDEQPLQRDVTALFNIFDRNGNDSLSLAEFFGAVDVLLDVSGEANALLKYFFETMNADSQCNTYVTKFEVATMLDAFETLQEDLRTPQQQKAIAERATTYRAMFEAYPWDADSRLCLHDFVELIVINPTLRDAFCSNEQRLSLSVSAVRQV